MAEDGSKPSIPAWQRARPAAGAASTEDSVTEEASAPGPEDSAASDLNETPVEPVEITPATAEVASENDANKQLEQMRAFLEDESVKRAPLEKKRAFFESKGISRDLIDQVLDTVAVSDFSNADFDRFKHDEAQVRQKIVNVPQQSRTENAPPIITYPEFLMEAHKPPPLITFNRLLNTVYIAGGLATLTYAANQYLLKPMTMSLTEARHEFATHSQVKLEEFNERLSKIVSKVPDAKVAPSTAANMLDDDAESISSDPTELYHRDMGTQTSPARSRSSSLDSLGQPKVDQKPTVEAHEDRLKIIRSHLDELAMGLESKGNKDVRKESMNDLRHYLDTLLYSSPGISMWSQADYGGVKNDGAKAKQDLIDEVKKEIRSVKGSLLSAKRFPTAMGAYGRVGAS